MAQVPTDIEKEAEASRADDTEGLAQAVDQLVSEIDKTVRTFEQDEAAPDEGPTDEPIVAGPIDEQIDELVDEATDAIGEPAPAPDAFEAPPSIDDLDEALASAADEDDDFDLEGDFEVTSSAQEPAPPAPAPPPSSASATPAPATPEPVADDSSVESPAKEPATKQARPKLDTTALVVGAIEKPARLLSAPLRMAPEAHRDTIGWIALNTLFLAICVWLYVLLLR
jgi:hypothetical protein